MRHLPLLVSALLLALVAACGPAQQSHSTDRPAVADPRALPWERVIAQARGRTVTMAMWQGSPAVNDYMRNYVTPHLAREYGIQFRVAPGQGDAIVTQLMTEQEAGRAVSAVDLLWINGETFWQLRQTKSLYGPFTDSLPNNRFVNWDNPFVAFDFQQPVEGYEAPWGNVQLLLITDSARVPDPPRTPGELATWIHAHPGRFTFDAGFTGMTFLKSLMYAFAESPDDLQGPFERATYERLRNNVFAWLDSVRSGLWREGGTFPASTAELHQLFANGELDFSMSFNDGEVANKVYSGLFPATATAYALTTGVIQNTHYLGIVSRSGNKAAAMVTADFLMSPAAQLHKLNPAIWGDGTVLSTDKIPPEWRNRFATAMQRRYAPRRSEIQAFARREPAPELMVELMDDFRSWVLRD